LAHLLADPIHTIASLVYTVYQCERLTERIRSYVDDARQRGRGRNEGVNVETRRLELLVDNNLWKELSIIGVTYREWGLKDIDVFLQNSVDRLLSPTTTPAQALRIIHHLRLTASLLAADRATYVLPIFITLLSFIIGIAGAYWRVADVDAQASSDGNTWLNIEAYSIAISAPFLHLIPAIFLSALIGVPQTETSHPNILNDFYDKLEEEGQEWVEGLKRIETPVVLSRRRSDVLGLRGEHEIEGDEEKGRVGETEEKEKEDMISSSLHHRISSGGMYAYRPELFFPSCLSTTLAHIALSFFFVFTSFLVASFIAYRVPPEGFDCRNVSLVLIMGIWLLSAALDFLLTIIRELSSPSTPSSPSYTYHLTLTKNLILSASVLTIILLIQLGIFNRCDCYSLWGRGPLGLPQIPQIEQILIQRIRGEWPAVTFGWVGLEMIICGLVVWKYKNAFRVYLQRDDGGSNGKSMMSGFMVKVRGWVGGAWRGVRRSRREWRVWSWRGRKTGGDGFVQVVTIEGVEEFAGELTSPVVVEMPDNVQLVELGK
ncbi:hypothetical protein QBC32DRAFT_222547, partial [Pseudoneurospora amorphoporcata]